MVSVVFHVPQQQNQPRGCSPKASTKPNQPQPKPLPSAGNGWRKEHRCQTSLRTHVPCADRGMRHVDFGPDLEHTREVKQLRPQHTRTCHLAATRGHPCHLLRTPLVAAKTLLSSQKTESLLSCDTEQGRDAQGLLRSPAWDPARALVPSMRCLGTKQPPPTADKSVEQAVITDVSICILPSHTVAVSRDRVTHRRNRGGSTAQLRGQRRSVHPQTPRTPHTRAPRPKGR